MASTKWNASNMGKKGGSAKTPKKRKAVRDNLTKARQNRWLKQTA